MLSPGCRTLDFSAELRVYLALPRGVLKLYVKKLDGLMGFVSAIYLFASFLLLLESFSSSAIELTGDERFVIESVTVITTLGK